MTLSLLSIWKKKESYINPMECSPDAGEWGRGGVLSSKAVKQLFSKHKQKIFLKKNKQYFIMYET